MITPMPPVEEPARTLTDARELLDGYLDYYRAAILRKLDGLSGQELRDSKVPSGWTALELLSHLTWVERRWFEWGFAGQPMEQPWGDQGPDGAWQVPPDMTADQIRAEFLTQRERSRRVLDGAGLAQRASTGGRFPTAEQAPTLAWILFHVLEEYMRHAGHLDIVRELTDGTVDD